MTILKFPPMGRVDLMQLTLGVIKQSPATAEEISDSLHKKGYFGASSEGIEQAIDGLHRNGYEIIKHPDGDAVRYELGDMPKGAA